MDESQENNDKIIPNAGILKRQDGTFCAAKFVIETNEETLNEELVVYTTEISADDLCDIDAVNEIDEYSILFVKIGYEFQFDEDSGLMEIQLSRIVTLGDSDTGLPVTADEVIETAPEELIPVYLDVIRSI